MVTKPPPSQWVKALSFGFGVLAIAVPKLMDLSPDVTIAVTAVGIVLVVTAVVALIGDWIRSRRSGSAVRLEIVGANLMGNPGASSANVVLEVIARNDGIPTTLRDWALEVTHDSDGSSSRGDHMVLALGDDIVYTNKAIRASDGLDARTGNVEIIRGGQSAGWLLFLMRGVSLDRLAREGTSFALSATDITGKTCRTTESFENLAAFGKSHGTRKE